jgi:phosphate transport system ATP-binding protein
MQGTVMNKNKTNVKPEPEKSSENKTETKNFVFKAQRPSNTSEERKIKIVVKNFNFYYGNTIALKNIYMDIEKHSVVGIIGPSGCGKSTFLRCINRMNDVIKSTRAEGEILIDGKNIYNKDQDVVTLRRDVGMVFQKSNPFPKSVFENVAYGLRINGVKDNKIIEQKVEQSLKDAAIWDEVKDRLGDSPFSFSGGQQQRLCIARALAIEPQILLKEKLYHYYCHA